MALVCMIVIDWVEKEIIEPVDKWVDELQEQCEQYPWYDPRGWFCWLVVVSVKITSYITKNITVEISKTVCFVMATLAYFPLVPIAWVIDEVSQTTEVYITIKTWLRTCSEAVLTDKTKATKPGIFNYSYTCECCDNTSHKISFLGEEDAEAYKYARKQCAVECTDP